MGGMVVCGVGGPEYYWSCGWWAWVVILRACGGGPWGGRVSC